jgi:hypothetical protein
VAVEARFPDALVEELAEPPPPALSPAFERPVPDKLVDVVEVAELVETEGVEPADPVADEPAAPADEEGGDALAPWFRPDVPAASPRSADACAVTA